MIVPIVHTSGNGKANSHKNLYTLTSEYTPINPQKASERAPNSNGVFRRIHFALGLNKRGIKASTCALKLRLLPLTNIPNHPDVCCGITVPNFLHLQPTARTCLGFRVRVLAKVQLHEQGNKGLLATAIAVPFTGGRLEPVLDSIVLLKQRRD